MSRVAPTPIFPLFKPFFASQKSKQKNDPRYLSNGSLLLLEISRLTALQQGCFSPLLSLLHNELRFQPVFFRLLL